MIIRSEGWPVKGIDAGLVPLEPRGEVSFPDEALVNASLEDLLAMEGLLEHLYSNQYYRVSEDLKTRDITVYWKFVTPTITSMKENK